MSSYRFCRISKCSVGKRATVWSLSKLAAQLLKILAVTNFFLPM